MFLGDPLLHRRKWVPKIPFIEEFQLLQVRLHLSFRSESWLVLDQPKRHLHRLPFSSDIFEIRHLGIPPNQLAVVRGNKPTLVHPRVWTETAIRHHV
jgi:hypothetical protein